MTSANRAWALADLDNRLIGLLGVGREGRAMAKVLAREAPGASLVALSQKDDPETREWAQSIGAEFYQSESGEGLPELLDVVIASPGFAPHNPLRQALLQRGIPETSATDLFFERYRERIIAVTGSKGKSTTSALIHHLLRHMGLRVELGGNLGIPLWDLPETDWIVAEVSSFQASTLHHSPHTAVLTALFEEHIDWHGSFEAYARDKLNLIAHQPPHIVVNATARVLMEQLATRVDPDTLTRVGPGETWHLVESSGRQVLARGDSEVMEASGLPLLGEHNAWNVLVALQAAETIAPVDLAQVPNWLRDFAPLPHRLEPVDDPSGIRFLNDSLATNPAALTAALRSLRGERVIAIVGGHDRGVDDSMLREELISHPIAGVIGIPDSGHTLLARITEWFDQAGIQSGSRPEMRAVSDMAEAVGVARSWAAPGDIVTLSPGAPSFGRYRDYQHRAEEYIRAIHQSLPAVQEGT